MKKQQWKRTAVVAAVMLALGGGLWSATAQAAKKADPAAYSQLRKQNAGQLAEQQRFVKTTEQAVAFSFGGLSKTVPLQAILQQMSQDKMHGTFFVTERELQRNGNNIALIRSYGQDLGVGLRPVPNGDFNDYCAQIERIQRGLADSYGVKSANVVRLMSPVTDDRPVREAVAAKGCFLAGQGLNVVQSKHKEARSVDTVMPAIFGKWTSSLNRGEIVYIRTDFYTDDTLAARLLAEIKKDKIDNIAYESYADKPGKGLNESGYRVVSIQNLLSDQAAAWQTVDTATLPQKSQPDYRDVTVDEHNFHHEFYKRYIGAPEVSVTDRMLGFSRQEMEQSDRTGVVKTVHDNTVFLTFDDWGSDDSINKLLYVLHKHKVNATFFIITWNMPNNPNLLRAIAQGGNEIGCHTNGHKAMAVQDAKGREVRMISDEEYRKDIELAYPKLAAVVGDVRLPSGRPALTRFLRPPTLAVSRQGCMDILNAGYTYIINGVGSTEDYSAVSMQSLVGIMNHIAHQPNGKVRPGAILIMHMSGAAVRTARALDILLTNNEQLPDGDPAKFKVGLLGDYLTGDYSQMMKQKIDKDYR
jgi:peptidoglycan/xylan/chitin deacetylase (PgdA/CDA1 family)